MIAEQSCTDSMVEMANINRQMVEDERIKAAEVKELRKQIGWLIDAAVPAGDGEYIVPAESVEDLRESVFGKRGVIDA